MTLPSPSYSLAREQYIQLVEKCGGVAVGRLEQRHRLRLREEPYPHTEHGFL